MAFAPGHLVGPYEVIRMLGSGGMGTVYLAYDRRLERRVALKFLREDTAASDSEWKGRLRREARAASALNHPNICHIYDVGGDGAGAWIAMEYVDGEPLTSLIGRDGLPPERAADIARQLADALAHAHAHGVLHRDLKSANIAIDTAGRTRILDFGIAARTPEAIARAATETETSAGVPGIAGTLPYLAPEVLRGSQATEQSDLWSLGVLMFEMLTGRMPFHGGSTFELASAILEHPPPALPAAVPDVLSRSVRRLLEKNPSERYRSAGDVRAALEPVAVRSATPSPHRLRKLALVGVAVVAVLASSLVIWRARQFAPVRVSEQRLLTTTSGAQRAPSLSPDGQRLAFVASDAAGVPQIWTRDIAGGPAVQITSGTGAGRPRWSPSGDRILYARRDSGIWSIPPLGGAPTQVVERGINPSVSRDGRRMAFEHNRRLWTAASDGSDVREVASVPPVYYSVPLGPALSPDGSQIAFFRAEAGPNGDLWVVSTDGGEPRQLTFDFREGGWPVWTPDGRAIVFSSARAGSRTLWQIRSSGGEPVPVTTGAGEDDQPDISSDGQRLIYSNVRNAWELKTRDLDSGNERTILRRALEILFPMFSPDGDRLVFFGRSDFAVAVFTINTDGSNLRQLTAGRELNHQPRWGSDGRQIFFFQVKPDASFRRIAAEGGPSVAFRTWTWETHNAPLFGPMGKLIAYVRQTAPGGERVEPDATLIHDVATARDQIWPPPDTHVTGWSPDGAEVVGWRHDGTIVRCPTAGAECITVTSGMQPVWSADARVFFRRTDQDDGIEQLWSVELDGRGERLEFALGHFRPFDRFFDLSREGVVAWAPFLQGQHELWAAELR